MLANQHIPNMTVGFMVKDRLGHPVFGTNTYHLKHGISELSAGQKMTLVFEMNAGFGEGSYSIAVALHANDTHVMHSYEWRDMALVFNVININKPLGVGSAWLPVNVRKYELA